MRLQRILFAPILLMLMAFMSCGLSQEQEDNSESNASAENDCVHQIITADDSLGRIRNRACKEITLSATIEQYVSAVSKLDFSSCPTKFTDAFHNHLKAWQEMQKFTERYSKMRGEMHDLFDQIKEGNDKDEFDPLLKEIWRTWDEVEKAKNDE